MKRAAHSAFAAVAFVLCVFSARTLAADLPVAVSARLEASLALITCPAGPPYPAQYATALVVASSASRSYLIAPVADGCPAGAATIYPRGNLARGWPVRAIGMSSACAGDRDSPKFCSDAGGMHDIDRGFEIVAIDAGNLAPVPLPVTANAGEAYVLSYTPPAGTSSGAQQARLNRTFVAAGQDPIDTRFVAARGVSPGGVLFTPSGAVIGMTAESLEPTAAFPQTPPATVDYRMVPVPDLRELIHFASEPIN